MAHKEESALPCSFHPVIQSWFAETFGKPTAVQAEAWPLIEKGEHVLALSPTGTGKTLTAFLQAISRFCPDSPSVPPRYPADKLTVLYVSPLKALNEDIKRNLLEPLDAIRSRFEKAGLPFPPVRVETRSGDTPQAERRRFFTSPPSILATTPESLAILLLNPRGRAALGTVRYLILDEIHAVLGTKRGAFLSCQIDRLSLIAAPFQRISLSATVRNPEIAAEFGGGVGRPVRIVSPQAEKQIDFRIEYPSDVDEDVDEIERIDKYGKRYTGLINYILNRISKGSTLLVFTDSRRRSERLCFFLNQEASASLEAGASLEASALNARNGGGFAGQIAFTHHGSLSKELRRDVERRLAAGSLPCVVATASLELGIDIGSVDEVVLAGSPSSVSQSLQRIGRSGHGAGRTSRGVLFPFHGLDLLLAEALSGGVEDRDIEELRPIENPLDILAQLILALCVEKNRNIEELYTVLRGFYIFRNLNKDAYTRTVRMLAGLGGKGRLREVKPRIWLDKSSGLIGALDGSLLLLYSSGGVIANRGLYSLRMANGVKIGELDEEFVWERRLGDCFDFGGRGWRITAINAESVEVLPLDAPTDFIPFWKADTMFRSKNLTRRVLGLLDCYNADGIPELPPDTALAALRSFLDSQQRAQGGLPLPDSGNITVEIIDSPETRGDFYSAVIHGFRGGAVHYPLSLALAQELEETLKTRVETFSSDDGILFLIPKLGAAEDSALAAESLFRRAFSSLQADGGGSLSRGERLFRNRLESSGVFGAAFREAAERSLLLPKIGFGKRTPLWIMRQRSKRLFDAVVSEDGFPVTAEAWRTCLADTFDMEGFRELVCAINNGTITLSFFRSAVPSPFSADMVRQETNTLMYEYDERKDIRSISDIPGVSPDGPPRRASLSDRVIEDALGNAALRPRLKQDLVSGFVSRLQRTLPGWAPDDELSLREWVKERIAIPLDEWETLRAALPDPLRESAAEETLLSGSGMGGHLKIIKPENALCPSVVHREWAETWENEALTLVGPWLRYEGPVSIMRITAVFGVDAARALDAVNALAEVDEAVCDVIFDSEMADNAAGNTGAVPAESNHVSDRENLEMLLRLSRKKARPVVRERPAAALVPFLALRQGIRAAHTAEQDGFSSAGFLNTLAVLNAPAKVWETEIFPARHGNYSPETLDREIREGRLIWYGAGMEKIGFCRPPDLELKRAIPRTDEKSSLAPLLQSGFFDRPRDFWEIKDACTKAGEALSSRDCANALWHEAWQGRLSSDSFEPVRRGLAAGFIPKETETPHFSGAPYIPGRHPRLPKALRDRWREGPPVPGCWFSLSIDEAGGDTLDEEYLSRSRIRLLLKRWGILCRPLLEHEDPAFSWSGLLPTIRRMELSGELIAGRFFAGIDSVQFASPAVIRELEAAEAFTGIYWMNAVDPASPAGRALGETPPCARLPGNRLYFKEAQLIAVSSRNGRDITLSIGPGDQSITPLIELFTLQRTRKVLPEPKILIETINGTTAARSEYASLFEASGFMKDREKLCLW